jgi:hypothetical protein
MDSDLWGHLQVDVIFGAFMTLDTFITLDAFISSLKGEKNGLV